MLNGINLNTNNAFTQTLENNHSCADRSEKEDVLSITSFNKDDVNDNKNKLDSYIPTEKKKKEKPFWLHGLFTSLITSTALLGLGYIGVKMGYLPFKTDTKGLMNSRTIEIEEKNRKNIGGIKSIMTFNSHCYKKSLQKLPENHKSLVVVMDKKDAKGIKTLTESKFKDNIIYVGELKLKQLKNIDEVKSYVKNIAEKLKKKKNYENVTFASENTRCANMLSAVLKAHSTNTKASSEDFVEGGIYSHYFWGESGLDANKLDQAIWSGWCEGLGLKTTEKPVAKTETSKDVQKTPDNKVTKEKSGIINEKDNKPEKTSDNIEQADGEEHYAEENVPDCKAFFETLRASFSKWFGKLKKYFTRNNKEL